MPNFFSTGETVHADEIAVFEEKRPARANPAVFDPCAFATWAEARAAFPYHSLIRIVDLTEGKQIVTPIFPVPDCSDLRLDGRTYVVATADCFDKQLSATELSDVLRSYDADVGPDKPRR